MSLFDIDWNNDGKIDFQDTLYDMALVDDDEHQTSSSDYSDDDIYDTDDLILSDQTNTSSSNTVSNKSGWLDNVPYESLTSWNLFYYNNFTYFDNFLKNIKMYFVNLEPSPARYATDRLDKDYKSEYTLLLNDIISKEEKEKEKQRQKQDNEKNESTDKKAYSPQQNINDIFTDAKKSIKEKENKSEKPVIKKADQNKQKPKQKEKIVQQKPKKNASKFNIKNYIYRQKGFYYPAAIKDKFKLEITVPSIKNDDAFELKNSIEEIITLRGTYFAVDVWLWCIDKFYPLRREVDEFDSTYLFDDIMEIFAYDDRFCDELVKRFEKNDNNARLIFSNIQYVFGLDDFFDACFKTQNIKLLKSAFETVIKNRKLKKTEVCAIIKEQISYIDVYNNFKFAYDANTLFLPFALTKSQNSRLLQKAKIEMSQSIKEAEEEEEEEKEEQEEEKEEQEEEKEEQEEEKEEQEEEFDENNEETEFEEEVIDDDNESEKIIEEYHANDQNDTTLITAYLITIDEVQNSCYYFSKAPLSLGDRVVVPYGKNNKHLNGTVKKILNTQVKDFNVPLDVMKYICEKI